MKSKTHNKKLPRMFKLDPAIVTRLEAFVRSREPVRLSRTSVVEAALDQYLKKQERLVKK